MSKANMINIYTCQSCGYKLVTIHVDEGVAPAIVLCPACCTGESKSAFYDVDPGLVPEGEFYKPSTEQELIWQTNMEIAQVGGLPDGVTVERILEANRVHTEKGGLCLRHVRMETLRLMMNRE